MYKSIYNYKIDSLIINIFINENINADSISRSESLGASLLVFLHTLAMTYPHHPNTVTKKKYYEFVQNLPLFLPVEHISGEFSKLIDKYPITPYLDNRDSFVRWMHFIHNKINEKLEKPQISLNEFFVNYYDEYKTQDEKLGQYYKVREKVIYLGIILGISGAIYYLYDK